MDNIPTLKTFDRIKRKLRTMQIASVLLAVATVVFICLYVTSLGAEKRSYQKLFDQTLSHTVDVLNIVTTNEFDYDTNYRQITAELGVLCQATYHIEVDVEIEKTMNELYYAFVKLPKQAKLHLVEVRDAMTKLRDGDIEAYKTLKQIIATFDKLDV